MEVKRDEMKEGDYYDGRMILECPCGHRWLERTELPMIVEAWLARAKAFQVCPKCGNNKKIMMLVGDMFREAIKELENVANL